MNEKNNIDNLFKNSITGYKIEPSEQVWQNVESGFFGKRRIAFYRWYILGAAALLFLLTAGGVLFFYIDDVKEELQFNEIITNSNDKLNTSDKILKDNNTSILDTGSDNSIELIEYANEDDGNQYSNQVEVILNNEQITDDHSKENSSKTVKYSATESEIYSLESSPFGNDNLRMPLSISIMSLDPRSIKLDYSPEVEIIDSEKVTGMSSYIEKQQKSHVYTGGSFTAGMVYYPSTKDQFTWSADLAFGLTAGKFYFETGISYQDMKERGIYAIELKSYDSVGYFNEVESFEIDPQNPEQILYNTSKVTVYDSLDHYTHTTPYFKYKYINIPLSIGFQFFNKQKFTASVSTGVSLSMLIESDIPEAEYYDPEFTVVRIRNMTPERVDWNVLWMMSIRLNYKLYKSLSISAEPVFTKYLSSIYDTEKGYSNVKPYTMNLRIGIYYGF